MKKAVDSQVLFEKIEGYLPPRAVSRVKKAFDYAEKAHSGQLRKSKDPYITHPVAVACILADLEQDGITLAAALLHDTVEDTSVTEEDLREEFGEDICSLVSGVTKLGKIYFGSQEEAQAENLRKMFLAMAKDLRVVLIKLADRLHNMRTLKFLPKDKQIRISSETREIFTLLAHRLGMWSVKWELEDLAFYYLQYDEFQKIKELVASRREEREQYVENLLVTFREILDKVSIKATVTGRPKHFYSIYKKLQNQGLSYDELYDVLGIRIILETVQDCYQVLGIMHTAYKPINGRFKDYIAMPKSNMYQSLHTTLIGPEGKPVEVQLRTWDMHQIAEFGIAAHWRYKEGKVHTKFDGDFSWLRQIIEAQQEKPEPHTFLQELKIDLFIDEVFVFTPRGDVQVLPKGATAVDFAYRIHTEIGHRCIGAKANGHIVPLHYQLQNGDRIEILTANQENPKTDWLNFVRTGHARSKIKYWTRKQNAQINLQNGKELLEKALIFAGYVPKEVLTTAHVANILQKQRVQTMDELYLQIAHGEVSPKALVRYFDDTFRAPQPEPDVTLLKKLRQPSRDNAQDVVRVLGEDNIVSHFAKCCAPLPGDEIIGFITLGHGVSVHKSGCRNVLRLEEHDRARLVSVEWKSEESKICHPVWIQVEAFERMGLLKDIIDRISDSKTNIRELKTKTDAKGGTMKATLLLDVHDLSHLKAIKQVIHNISDVYDVYRT